MKKYYTVKSIDLAKAMVFITGQQYYVFNDVKEGGLIYSFENTENLQKSLYYLNKARKELHK